MATKKRDIVIDIVKAIGIILMVFYHAGTPGKSFVYLFHMALFFICSGYCYSHNAEKDPVGYIKKKLLTLYVPCVLSGVIIACLQNVFLDIHIYSYEVYEKLTFTTWLKQVIKCLAFGGGHQMIGANWFFRTLFFSSVLYMFLHKTLTAIIRDEKMRRIIRSCVCVMMTTIGGIVGPLTSLGKYFNFLTVMMLFELGYILKETQLLQKFDNVAKRIIAIALSFVLLLVLNQHGEISINSNIIINPIYFALCSSAGFLMTYSVAVLIARSRFKNVFVHIGQTSIWIMFFHYIGFKLITLVEILALKEPISNLSAYPTHHTENGMWLIYGISGIGIPLLMVLFAQKGTKHLRDCIKKE